MYRKKKGSKKRRNTSRGERRFAAGIMLLLLSVALNGAAVKIPEFADWYSEHIYTVTSGIFSRISGIVPFSAAELCLYTLIILILGTGIHAVFMRKRIRFSLFCWFGGVFLTVSVLVFLYVANCGINYHRTSFAVKADMVPEGYSVEELRETCVWLTGEVERTAGSVGRNEKGELKLEGDVRQEAVQAMSGLGEQYPDLSGYYPKPKPVLLSELLSYQKITGIYMPFTVEANYNADMPAYDKPFTMCHELSHLKGFMQEEEANFIAFLACMNSESEVFRYSGALSAWEYAMNALWKADPVMWEEVRGKLDQQAEVDLSADDRFWAQYDGSVAEVSNRMNDAYLKANGQDQGVKSYGMMADLLVRYYKYHVSGGV